MRWNARIPCADRTDWLARRRLGSSDAAAVLGLSPYSGAYRVWRRLIGRPVPQESRAHMQQGLRWEPVIRTAYHAETGREIRAFDGWCLFVGPEDWATSTPDGVVLDGEWGLAELKLAFQPGAWPESQEITTWRTGLLPRRDWVVQCLHQMWVLDAPWCELVILLPFHQLRVYRLHRQLELERRLVGKLRDWYLRHVVEGVTVRPPGPAEALAALADELQDPNGRRQPTREPTAQELVWIQQLHQAREHTERVKLWGEAIQVQLYASAGRAGRLVTERNGVRWTASIVRDPPHVRIRRTERHGNAA